MSPLAAYLLLFVAVGIGFIFVHLMAGKFIRPNKPYADKRTIYECGEPTIGSAWIQFDVRFYVVALLFVIFDVEVAFFFPWAVVFGKANALASTGKLDSAEAYKETGERTWELIPPAFRPNYAAQHNLVMATTDENVARLNALRQQKVQNQSGNENRMSVQEQSELSVLELGEQRALQPQQQARQLAWLALIEIAVFFGVLLVGYAYLWRRGDLAWVRSLAAERSTGEPLTTAAPAPDGAMIHS
ncbi:MAG TPA: NADH-quinone oxidoreductase subunit A [Candidatus Binataceae bacterium]|nr:NADH-quinone oxidoreductase subunit A [Candidatus Binataceae bacterium]